MKILIREFVKVLNSSLPFSVGERAAKVVRESQRFWNYSVCGIIVSNRIGFFFKWLASIE